MPEFGYVLSSEEHPPTDLVRNAQRAEEAGFTLAWISDHFHPWISAQGQSPFAWAVIGGVASTTERLELGTGVTCPTVRYHPAIIAQAAATAASMMPGRFFLGVGSGENLNEHIVGEHWPPADVRIDRLAEAIDIIRTLWQGGNQSYYGHYFTAENARIYTLPNELPPIMVAASGPTSMQVAGEFGDGLITMAPLANTIKMYKEAGGDGKPTSTQVTVCWDDDKAAAKKMVHKIWPNTGVPGQLSQELALPQFFEQAVQLVTEEKATQHIPCGPDPQDHIKALRQAVDAGFDRIFIHQIGPKQEQFIRFYQQEVLPQMGTGMS